MHPMLRWSSAGLLLLAVSGCATESPPTAPEDPERPVAATLCSDDYCGPTDGTVHDGTGLGVLPNVPGDPSPGAKGMWLGNTVSKQWCYADYNAYVNDADNDWLDDECEYQLAKAFAPVFAISPADGCAGGEPYWAARYINNGQPNWGPFVRIAYLPAYYQDCGAAGHAGDSEFLMLGVQFILATRHWEVREAYLSAHAGTPNNASDYVRIPDDLDYPRTSRAYPRIWIARSKHGNYRTRNECNSRAVFNDDCSDNQSMGRLRMYRSRNVGSRFVDFLPGGVLSANPQLSIVGRREYFYNQHNFGGWQPAATGVTPYADLLGYYAFECYDYTYIFLGTCYYGPSGQRPAAAATPIQGVVDGPTAVTAQQSYTWTSFVTGGVPPYRGEWYRKYFSEATPTLVATTTGTRSATNSTAGSWPGLVNKCEAFTITLKAWSSDGQMVTDDHAVTNVTCPPPPLSASITGPSLVTVKSTYTYTLVLSGFSGPSYTWAERFCTNAAGTSCTWKTLTGFGLTVGRVLGPDCSGIREANYQLKAVVTNNDGRQVTAQKVTALCQGLN